MDKIRALDGLRGVAALLVLWAHFPVVDGGLAFDYFHKLSRVFYAGYLGVDIFFALSGFLITRILLDEKRRGMLSFKRFYWKRTVRIFPLYYLVVVLVGVVISWENLGWSAAYLSNYYFSTDSAPNALRHTWSLCVEEHFYLFWPLMISSISVMNAKRVITYVLPGVAVLSAVLALQTSEFGVALVNKATHIRVLTISLGSMLAFHEKRLYEIGRKKMVYLTVALLLFFTGLVATHLIDNLEVVVLNRFIMSAGVSVLLLIVVVVMQHRSPGALVATVLYNPVFEFMGKISYGVYLYHLPILYYFGVSHMGDNQNVSLIFGLTLILLCVGIPTASFYIFEKPLLRFKGLVR